MFKKITRLVILFAVSFIVVFASLYFYGLHLISSSSTPTSATQIFKTQNPLIGEWTLSQDLVVQNITFAKAGLKYEFYANGECDMAGNGGKWEDLGDKIKVITSDGTEYSKYKLTGDTLIVQAMGQGTALGQTFDMVFKRVK